jgi:hypothetical protein
MLSQGARRGRNPLPLLRKLIGARERETRRDGGFIAGDAAAQTGG